jgi:hypothetical protein
MPGTSPIVGNPPVPRLVGGPYMVITPVLAAITPKIVTPAELHVMVLRPIWSLV